MAREIVKLRISDAGMLESNVVSISLQDGHRFFGFPPHRLDNRILSRLPSELRAILEPVHMRLAVDIVCRYVYPQADVTIAPPYPLNVRMCMHPQHRDTIHDIPNLSPNELQRLCDVFAVCQGNVVIDVGGFIGLGATRLSEMVGIDGKVISFEASPVNQRLYRQNASANGCQNVELLPKGAWKEATELEIDIDSRQGNSLIFASHNDLQCAKIPVDKVDNVVQARNLPRVDLVSLTINGAEPEALLGMDETIRAYQPNISAAGWYKRDGRFVHHLICELLARYDYNVLVGRGGRVYAWSRSRGL